MCGSSVTLRAAGGQLEAHWEPELRFIPYYAWANRGVGEMRVFVRE